MPEVVTLENGRIKLRHRNDVKNSSWHYRFYFNQETIRKSTFTTNLDDAKQIAKDHYYECRNRVKTGLPIIDYKLRDVQEEFLKGFENKNISAKKQKDRKAYYRGMLKYWVELYGDRSLSQITQRNINDYLPWRLKYWTEGPGKNKKRHPRVKENPKDTTLGFEFGALRAVYSYALQQGYVAHGKIPTIKYDGGERGTRPALSLEQYKTISDAGYKWVDEAAGKPYHWKRWMTHHYFNIMTLTGLRVNEARYLKWGDIEAMSLSLLKFAWQASLVDEAMLPS